MLNKCTKQTEVFKVVLEAWGAWEYAGTIGVTYGKPAGFAGFAHAKYGVNP